MILNEKNSLQRALKLARRPGVPMEDSAYVTVGGQ